MRGLQRRDTAQLVMDGWNIYYNYFRPHESLGNKTPAEKVVAERPFTNWEDVARHDVRPFSQQRIVKAKPFRTMPIKREHVRSARIG